MKKFFIFIIIVVVFAMGADELAEQQQKLQELNDQIEALERHLQDNQSQKQEKKAEIDEMEKKKKELESKINKLETDQDKAKQEWDKTKDQLENTSKDLNTKKQSLQELYNSAHELGKALVVSHFSNTIDINADAVIISEALSQADNRLNSLNANIISLEEERKSLEKKEKKDATYFKDVQWTRIVSKKKKSKYQKQIKSLDKEVVSLDQEYNNALKKKEELEQMQQEMNRLITQLQQRRPSFTPQYSYRFTTSRLPWPVKGELLRGYGDYKGANKKISLHNDGIDISAEIGTEVMCIDKGVVAFAGRNGASGRVVIIDHQNGYYSVYSHNDHISVALGDFVERGTVLALSGKSGLTDVPCLHFEIRKDGRAEDPLKYLE